MHKVKQWAHHSAHSSNYNPWSQEGAVAVAAGAPGPAEINHAGEPEKDKSKIPLPRKVYEVTKTILLRSWVNVFLIFVPVGIAVHFAGINSGAIFGINAVAIIPLAGLLTFATECVAHRLGPTLGALMNVSFGNAVELIIFIIALVKNEIRIVQAALIGSILANLLLILGMAFLIGGLQYREQLYDSMVTQMSACLLALAVLSLLIPTAFHASFNDPDAANTAVLKLSRGTSIILLLTYLLYLAFQLKSHAYLYQGTPQHVIDAQTEPGLAPVLLARLETNDSSSTSTTSTSRSGSGSGSHHRVKKRLKAKLGRKREEKTEIQDFAHDTAPATHQFDEKGKDKGIRFDEPQPHEQADEPTILPSSPSKANSTPNPARPKATTRISSFRPKPPPVFRAVTNPAPTRPPDTLRRLRSTPRNDNVWLDENTQRVESPTRMETGQKTEPESDEPAIGQTSAIVLLLVSTGLVALCAEFLVGSIEDLVETSPLSEAFIGLIILPIVGNAAEHVTAVTVAAKNKLDLALGVALGSSIQIALFVTPLVVILGWCMNKEMSLYFNLFETMSIFVATFIVNFLVLDGRSNYLEGALLCACYVIIGVAAYLFPDSENQAPSTAGPGSGT